MSNILPFSFAGFPRDNKKYKLSSYTPLNFNSSGIKEPTIGLLLTPYLPQEIRESFINKKSSYDYSNEILVEIGVGEILNLPVGSIIENGGLVALPSYSTLKVKLSIEKENIQVIRAYDKYYYGKEEYYYISKSYYPLPKTVAKTRHLLIKNKKTEDKDVDGVILSCFECLRYYNTSSKLIRKLSSGGLLGSNQIFDPQFTWLEEDKTGHVQLRKNIDDPDADAIARFALNNEVYKDTLGIYDSIVCNNSNGEGFVPVVYPPFRGESELVLHGKYIKSGESWFFFVFWIESCTGSYPYLKLFYDRDNDSRSAPGSSEILQDAWKGTVTPLIRKSGNTREDVEINNAEEPNLNRVKMEIILPPRNFLALPPDAEKAEKRECNYKAADKTVFGTFDVESGFSTSEGTYADTSITPLTLITQNNFKEINRLAPLTANFENLISSLEYLENKYDGVLSHKFININTSDSPDELSIFPKNSYKNGFLDWSFINEKNGRRRRRVMVVEVVYKDSFFYIFEAEKRPSRFINKFSKKKNKIIKEEIKESIATLVVNQTDCRQLGERILWQVTLHGAENEGVWKNNWRWGNLNYKKFDHKPASIPVFAGRFIDYFETSLQELIIDSSFELEITQKSKLAG